MGLNPDGKALFVLLKGGFLDKHVCPFYWTEKAIY